MESTGKNFDMNPETFTLENLFAMELHNFSDTISDIVGSATKELNIEKSLHEVVTTWHSQRFSIHKYVLNCSGMSYVCTLLCIVNLHSYVGAEVMVVFPSGYDINMGLCVWHYICTYTYYMYITMYI